jgi:ADP-ribose pyrophosphatase
MGLKEGERFLDDGEVIEVIKVPFERSLEMVMNNEIFYAISCMAILKAERYLKKKGLIE